MPDTIVAPATVTGTASLSVIRLSGPEAPKIACALTQKTHFVPRYATLCNIYDTENAILDESIVIYFQAPHSYTTEEVVEIQCHGGPTVLRSIITRCLEEGARHAKPGEFTKRAFLGGRIDMAKAEAIASLIHARSEDAAKMLARQLEGELSDTVAQIRTQLLQSIAAVEVSIDYAEEDLPDDLLQTITQGVALARERLEVLLDASLRRRQVWDGYRLSIIGKPNVGKSSLLNRLLEKERAIVSEIEGTTRDTIEESLHIKGHWVKIIDTAGIHHTTDSVESIGIERSIQAAEESDIIIALFDGSRPLDEKDRTVLGLIEQYQTAKPIIPVLNKSDLSTQLTPADLALPDPLPLSCQQSIQPLWERLESLLHEEDGQETLLLATERQIETTRAALEAIQQAEEPATSGEWELFSFHIQEAIAHVGAITHPVASEEILDQMFGDFCLGK